MNDLSLKGVARRFGGHAANLSVVNDIYAVPNISGSVSLRAKLESMSRQQHSFGATECIFGWTAAFEQTWTHIVIRIRLNPDAGISNATVSGLETTWANGIETTWTHRWRCGRAGELPCRLSFDVQWVNANQHHTVRIRPGPERSNMTTWDDRDDGPVAAHEFGHMLGNVDEYAEPAVCPNRNPVNTGTVMDSNSNNVPARMMTRFANNIGSNVVAI
jgi:hypothetical protein